MAQDTRKDPRAKVLSMTVRYKSATVDEFIEHHAQDVSRGGIYIKTPSPFPPGTLLKFEIRIADEQSVLAGVGRVVWKREPDGAAPDSPAGMGVKFIKIDDKSKNVITRLVDRHGGRPSTFERGADSAGADVAAAAAGAEPSRPQAKEPVRAAVKAEKRASTMLGLGAIGGGGVSAEPAPPPPAPPPPQDLANDAGFFPKAADGEADTRPPEERTVMKQAAELLQQALSEAGGTLDEVGTPEPAPAEKKPTPPPFPAVTGPAAAKEDAVAEATPLDLGEPPPAPKPKDEPAPKPQPKLEPVAAAKPAARIESSRPAASTAAPISARAEAEEEGKGGGSRILLIVLAAAVIGGGVLFAMKSGDETTAAQPTSKPTATATTTVAATSTATSTAAPAPTAAETQAPAGTATAEPTASPTQEPVVKATAEPKPPETAKPPPPKPPPPKPPPTDQPPKPPPTATAAPKPPPTGKPPGEEIYD